MANGDIVPTCSINGSESRRTFSFESYGVNVAIESHRQELVDEAVKVARKALLNRIRPSVAATPDCVFKIELDGNGTYLLFKNGEELSSGDSRKIFFKFFDSMIRVAVARDAVDHVFVHAGVVGWKEKAIMIPGASYQGKSTLVAELVRNGAVYYSDDFAILDKDGHVHPFQRSIAMRTNDGEFTPYEITAESLGGVSGTRSIPVGMVLLTKYKRNGVWNPKLLSPGSGVLEMIPFTISLDNCPEFSLSVLKNVASRAIIASSLRGSAKNFAKTLLNFVDKNVY